MILKGNFIVKKDIENRRYKYEIVDDILDYKGNECIIVHNLNPDFTLFLNNLSLIITEKGSPLSHLAIIAREYEKPVLAVENITKKIPERGELSIVCKNEHVEIKFH
jgi:phosphohistidine swiveling domain-containing protein